jgi:hypothetical protein
MADLNSFAELIRKGKEDKVGLQVGTAMTYFATLNKLVFTVHNQGMAHQKNRCWADNDVTETWAAGTALYDKIWDSRLSYTYI